ncbi:putative phage protein [Pseudomonas entomophila L48]|uniref:Putative phage protein n=1 Tax=Pseudomonas entomophila (strain L48) TaxID=384676 RepID=Q1I689_PSEE4|nr:putative phage protein [Pseudomonas entomophila L48]
MPSVKRSVRYRHGNTTISHRGIEIAPIAFTGIGGIAIVGATRAAAGGAKRHERRATTGLTWLAIIGGTGPTRANSDFRGEQTCKAYQLFRDTAAAAAARPWSCSTPGTATTASSHTHTRQPSATAQNWWYYWFAGTWGLPDDVSGCQARRQLSLPDTPPFARAISPEGQEVARKDEFRRSEPFVGDQGVEHDPVIAACLDRQRVGRCIASAQNHFHRTQGLVSGRERDGKVSSTCINDDMPETLG